MPGESLCRASASRPCLTRCAGAGARGARADDRRVICWHLTTSPACPPGSRMDFYEPPAVLQVWPKNPGALARRIRRAQTFLRMLGIVHPRGASGSPDDQDKGIENRPTIVSAAVSNGCHEISIRGGNPFVSDADDADATSARLPLICVPPETGLRPSCRRYMHRRHARGRRMLRNVLAGPIVSNTALAQSASPRPAIPPPAPRPQTTCFVYDHGN